MFSADGQMLVAAKLDGNLRLRGLAARNEQTIRLGNFHTHCSAFSSGGWLLALGDSDSNVRVWDLNRVVNKKTVTPVMNR